MLEFFKKCVFTLLYLNSFYTIWHLKELQEMRAQNAYVYFGIEVEKIITLSILLTESTWFIANTGYI